jgi:electron transport complex protein RnfD
MIVSVSPHYHKAGATTTRVMLDVIIALIPALVASCVIFGFRSLLLVAISAANCVLLEWVWNKLMKKPDTVTDLSAIVTGMLLAYNVPATMPIWQLIVGDFIAIIIVKMLFGGIGCNFVNPALVGRVALMFSFPASMTDYATHVAKLDALTGATPLASAGELGWSDFMTLFLGQHGGVLGETCAAALLAGGVYLCIRRVIKPWLPLAYIGSAALFTLLFGGANPVLSIFSGGLLLGAVFMATDYATTPLTKPGKLLFGIGCGVLTFVIRQFSTYPEGMSFAILLMNLLTPYLDRMTRTHPFGADNLAGKEKPNA